MPSLDDLTRLDARFVLDSSLVDALARRYRDDAFVVYQFAPGAGRLHPFAYSFVNRYDDRLLFPTVHVHDGAHMPATAAFDHELYAQMSQLPERSEGPVGELDRRYRGERPGGRWRRGETFRPDLPAFVDPALPAERLVLVGERPNEDTLAALAPS